MRFTPSRSLPHHGEQAAEPFAPIREQVYILKLFLDAGGHATIVQAHGDDKDFVQWNAPGALQAITDFRLKPTLFAHRVSGIASHEEIGGLNRFLDRPRPILPRHQFAPIHPGREGMLVESAKEPVGGGCIFLHVGQEYLWQAAWPETEPAAGARAERAQAVNLYGLPFLQALSHNRGDLAAVGEFPRCHLPRPLVFSN
jgi:hypothetical protein